MSSSLSHLHVAVLMGGPGSERRISLASGEAVVTALEATGARVTPVDVEGPDFTIPADADVAFNVIHGTFGEDGTLQEILEGLGVPYTGAGVASSRLAFDKVVAKERFVERGVPTPRSELLRAGERPSLPVPLVIKPPREGSSVGIHIVRSEEETDAAMADAIKYGAEILVEECIEGKELTVGVLGGEALPVVHIAPQDGWYDINNKYPWLESKGKTDYFCPADLSEVHTAAVQSAALAAHESLGIEIYSRVDILLDEERGPFVLEANTLPGMTASSLLPKAAEVFGLGFPELCARIVQLSLDCPRNDS